MTAFAKQFQDEVKRLARKECKVDLQRLKTENTQLRKNLASLRKRLEKLERANKRVLKKVVPAEVVEEVVDGPEKDMNRARISSKTIMTLRQRLGLTQVELGALLGVSGQSVYQWERKGGRLTLRRRTLQAVLEAKNMGVKEARERIAAVN